MNITKTQLREDGNAFHFTDSEGRKLLLWKASTKNARWELTPASIESKSGSRYRVEDSHHRHLEASLAGDASDDRILKRVRRAFNEWSEHIDRVRVRVASADGWEDRKRALSKDVAAVALPLPHRVGVVWADSFEVTVRLQTAAQLEKLRDFLDSITES